MSATQTDRRVGASSPLTSAHSSGQVADPVRFTGAADRQVATFVDQVRAVVERHPRAAAYTPEPIL